MFYTVLLVAGTINDICLEAFIVSKCSKNSETDSHVIWFKQSSVSENYSVSIVRNLMVNNLMLLSAQKNKIIIQNTNFKTPQCKI